MPTLTPPLPGEARPPTAAPSIPPCSGRGGVFPSTPASPHPPNPGLTVGVFPSAPSPAQEPHTTATGGGATPSENVREALRARLTAALEQLDVVADHALPVFAEGVSLGLCRAAGLPPTTVVPASELDPLTMARRWAELEASCRGP